MPHLPVSFSFSENVFDFLRLTSDDLELTICKSIRIANFGENLHLQIPDRQP